jgi:citrate lyase beta subunit
MLSQIHLGASLYVPATYHPEKLAAIGNGERISGLRSLIYCTEDAVREDELAAALGNLQSALPLLKTDQRPLRFIRVRNPYVFGRCLAMSGIAQIDGFVLPKVTTANLYNYVSQLTDRDRFKIMPTLETAEVFDYREMNKLRRMLQDYSNSHPRILCLRIGGNDLLNCLRRRRDSNRTIYDSPLGAVISRLSGEFVPYGFGLTAPVFESMAHPDVLREEVELDLAHGLFGKTAIHPEQIALIERGFAVDQQDLREAQMILDPCAAAVFKEGDRMCEPTTHSRWAEDIVARSEIYGVRGSLGPGDQLGDC